MAPKCSSTARIDGKTIVITGSNTGIGKETGKELARRGARIIIACRNVEKGEEAKKEIQQETNNENIEVMKLDLASLKSVKEFSTQLLEKESKIHILINNAGIMMVDKAKTEDNFELQIGTNHLGPVLLTMLLLDRMKESAPARIINVSSKFHAWGSIKWDDFNSEKSYSKKHEYAQSKLANILFARELSKRIEGTGVTVNCLHPGVVDTEIGRSLPLINNSIVRALTAPLRWAIMLTPEQGAQTSIYCAVAEELEGVTGEYFSNCAKAKPSRLAQSDEDARRLWDMSMPLVGLKADHLPPAIAMETVTETAEFDGVAAAIADGVDAAQAYAADKCIPFADDINTVVDEVRAVVANPDDL